jgi:hypothetical protein
MQGNQSGPTWIWQTCLMESVDFTNAATMTWPYPINYALGVVNAGGPPSPLYSQTLPTSMPDVGGSVYLFPSSLGGHDAYMNIFATAKDTWNIPSTTPFYGYTFSIVLPSASAITVPSSSSIYEFVWEKKGLFGQYLVFSGDEVDCTGSKGGNKGRSYSVGSIPGGSAELYYFTNPGDGSREEWAMGIFVNDAVTIPVNKPGVSSKANPYGSFSSPFDVGVATVTPNASSGQAFLKLMTNDYAHPGTSRVFLAGSPWSGPAVPYGNQGRRLPHAFDYVTQFFSLLTWVWAHNMDPGYPAPLFGTTAGGHSLAVQIPPDPALYSIELKICGFSSSGLESSASFMVTYF